MFIAITKKGKEFFYRSSTRLSVPKSSAQKILGILNRTGYKLQEGEVWHLYETEGELMMGDARMYKGNVRISWEAMPW